MEVNYNDETELNKFNTENVVILDYNWFKHVQKYK